VNARRTQTATISDGLIDAVRSRLSDGRAVRRTLPGGGRVHIDRPLPFLCIYREPTAWRDAGTKKLVFGEASFLITPGAPRVPRNVTRLLETIIEVMVDRFAAFLVLEVWATPGLHNAPADEDESDTLGRYRPTFRIAARGLSTPMRVVAALARNLQRIRYLRQSADVEIDRTADSHPPDLPLLLSSRRRRQLGCDTIGLAVRPIYRDAESGDLYPDVLRILRRGVGLALKQAFFTFAQTRSNATPRHYYSLGRRAMVKAVWDVDRRLAAIADTFDFLLQVTPLNAEAAWGEFRSSKYEKTPRFYYRPLAVEPATLKRRLYDVPIERIEDPTLAHLFRQRQDELDRKITMLADIGTHRFLQGSLQVYGRPDPSLLSLASDLLAKIPPHARDNGGRRQLDAHGFAEHARAEIDTYQRQHPDFAATVSVRDDIFSGLLCSGGNLLIGRQTRVPSGRVRALLQHEVGTHLLTYYNGLASRFQQLHSGFAGYDAMQEGLAVLSEYLVGGLSRPRLRLLAARVMAAAQLIAGATFIETFRLLQSHFTFTHRVAYTITMRTYRGGGLTKDMVYLRGLTEILTYLADGGDLEPLFVGKIASDHIPFIRELQLRQVLLAPPLRPRYLSDPLVLRRLEKLRNGMTVFDLIGGKKE